LFAGLSSYGQAIYCTKSEISKIDSVLIEQFWADFKSAINNEDKAKLASLIRFSFNCDYCVLDSIKEKNYDYLKVSKKLFNRQQYAIFFDTKLKNTANRYDKLFDILSVSNDEAGKVCQLSFSYVSFERTNTWEGQQHFFTIKKVRQKFLITAAWTIP
jgi:hypothetical protein